MIPGVAYTAPEVAWVGETELSAKASGRKITKTNFPWAASGRAIAPAFLSCYIGLLPILCVLLAYVGHRHIVQARED